jgi:hypothetical protein
VTLDGLLDCGKLGLVGLPYLLGIKGGQKKHELFTNL